MTLRLVANALSVGLARLIDIGPVVVPCLLEEDDWDFVASDFRAAIDSSARSLATPVAVHRTDEGICSTS